MINNSYHLETISKIIKKPTDLKAILDQQPLKNKVVLVKGVYDLFHTGHYYSFVNAKNYGDVLIVAVNSDFAVRKRKGKKRPIINQEDRMTLIAALSCVDWVTLYDNVSPYNVLKIIRPDVFAASHFDSLDIEHKTELQEFITFQIMPKLGANSTTDLIKKIMEE